MYRYKQACNENLANAAINVEDQCNIAEIESGEYVLSQSNVYSSVC